MNQIFPLLAALAITLPLDAQSVLDTYIRMALETNPRVREKTSLEASSAAALEYAARLGGPTVNFITTYTLATGGRSADFPVGDLLNPVYAALNEVTGTNQFPQIENQRVPFLPSNFYDARLHIDQPVIQPQLRVNRMIKEEEVTISSLQTDEVRRDILREVKTAYFRWLQAREGIAIFDEGLALLKENKRVTQSLLANGQAIPSTVLRIQAEIDKLTARRDQALALQANAAAYLNLLLNRPANATIEAMTLESVPSIPSDASAGRREELLRIETGKRIQQLAGDLAKKSLAPTVGAFIDIGSQEFAPDWGGYVFGGVRLMVPLFDNRQAKYKQAEYAAQTSASEASLEWAREAFDTEVLNEIEQLRADVTIYRNFESLVASTQRYYEETEKRYKAGLTGYIELIDARTQVTSAQFEQNNARYEAWVRHATIERLTASAPLQ